MVRRLLVALALLAGLSASAGAFLPSAEATTATPCRGYVALTFDDGPSPTTGLLLDRLAALEVRATFFNLGRAELHYPGAVRREARVGMWFGNHSYDHPYLTQLSPDLLTYQLRETRLIHHAITNRWQGFFRAPYGDTNDAVRAEAARRGMVEALWTVDTKDYESTTDQIVARALTVKPGGIIVMHDGKAQTRAALPRILAGLRGRHLCAGKLARSSTPQQVWPGLVTYVKAVKP
jgi:peptidoglycan/xylan/chitin deacetylase (PgdA/CDA1 family)